MKYLYLLVFVLIFCSCRRTKYVKFDGNITGINNGILVISDPQGNQLISALISDGKFQAQNLLPRPGFYDMFITPELNKNHKRKLFEIYLEGGNYTITSDTGKIFLYPSIKSDSKIQNELSDYYAIETAQKHVIKAHADSIGDLLYASNSHVVVYSKKYNNLKTQFDQATTEIRNIDDKVLTDYIAKKPQNDIEAFVLAQIDYKKDPEKYYSIYKKFSPEQKRTDEGITEGADFEQLMKLIAGSPAPKIKGKTLDGKPFDPKAISSKKVILVEFWESDSEICELNHVKLMNAYSDILNDPKFGVVSISLDSKRIDWVSAVQKQKLSWIQVSDLQGQNSLNMTDWAVSVIPTYDLVDGNWHIIKRNIDFKNIVDEVKAAMKK
jgi:peroxiredoxin